MVGWSTDTKNGYDDLEEYMEYGYVFVSLTDRNRAKMAYSLFKFKKRAIRFITWWRHQMETFSALLAICAGNSPVHGEFPAQRPVTRSFDVPLICARIYGWVNNHEAGDLRRHHSHYDVIVMTRSKYTAHTDPLFKQANLQPISDLFIMNILQMHHRFKHGKFRNVSWIYSTKIQCVHTTLEQILF